MNGASTSSEPPQARRCSCDPSPPRQRALFEDVEGRITLAFELVDTHVCAAAQSVVGNLLTPFAQGVCYERDGLRGAAIAANETSLPPCMDLYSRTSELKGLRWF